MQMPQTFSQGLTPGCKSEGCSQTGHTSSSTGPTVMPVLCSPAPEGGQPVRRGYQQLGQKRHLPSPGAVSTDRHTQPASEQDSVPAPLGRSLSVCDRTEDAALHGGPSRQGVMHGNLTEGLLTGFSGLELLNRQVPAAALPPFRQETRSCWPRSEHAATLLTSAPFSNQVSAREAGRAG
jgi:hypothetical protein